MHTAHASPSHMSQTCHLLNPSFSFSNPTIPIDFGFELLNLIESSIAHLLIFSTGHLLHSTRPFHPAEGLWVAKAKRHCPCPMRRGRWKKCSSRAVRRVPDRPGLQLDDEGDECVGPDRSIMGFIIHGLQASWVPASLPLHCHLCRL